MRVGIFNDAEVSRLYRPLHYMRFIAPKPGLICASSQYFKGIETLHRCSASPSFRANLTSNPFTHCSLNKLQISNSYSRHTGTPHNAFSAVLKCGFHKFFVIYYLPQKEILNFGSSANETFFQNAVFTRKCIFVHFKRDVKTVLTYK